MFIESLEIVKSLSFTHRLLHFLQHLPVTSCHHHRRYNSAGHKLPNPLVHPPDIPLVHPAPGNMAPDALDGRKLGVREVLHLDLGVLGREVLIRATGHDEDFSLDAGERLVEHVVVAGPAAAERRDRRLFPGDDRGDVAHLPHAAEDDEVVGVPVDEAGAAVGDPRLDARAAHPGVRVALLPGPARAARTPPSLAEPGRARQPGVVGAAEGAEALLGPQLLPIAAESALAAALLLRLDGRPRDVVDGVAEGADRPLEEGVVVAAGAGAAARDDAAGREGRVHDGPVVGLLGAHAEAEHGGEVAHAEVGRQQGVLGADAVFVVQFAGGGEEGLVGRRGGLAVAEHRDDDDVVVGQARVRRGREGQRRVDFAAILQVTHTRRGFR